VSARAFAVFMGLLAVVGLLGYGLLSKNTDSLAVGDPLPAPGLEKLDGSGTGSVADYRGRWVLVNVWASWCIPCRDESPALERFYDRHRRQGFTVVGIDSRDASDDGLRFLDEYGITYPQLHDDGSYAKDLGATGVPESYLADPRGDFVLHRPGPVTPEYLDKVVLPYIEGRIPA
jgi:cytochrome c biogenesis protein CcmG, thiol:disulfide interchange protein DsbE